MTPLAKAVTGRQAVAGASEIVEAFGGAGYVEDTGIPVLLRDAHVLPIWEGTTNVLALDLLLRAELDAGLAALVERVARAGRSAAGAGLGAEAAGALTAIERAIAWHRSTRDPATRQAGARRFALTLGRALELALLAEHAGAVAAGPDAAAAQEACRRFRAAGLDRLEG